MWRLCILLIPELSHGIGIFAFCVAKNEIINVIARKNNLICAAFIEYRQFDTDFEQAYLW